MALNLCKEPVYLIFLVILVESLIVMSFYAYTGANFGSLTDEQAFAYVFTVASNAIIMFLSFMCALYLYRDKWKYSLVLLIIVISTFGFGVSIVSVVYFNFDLTKESIKSHVFPIYKFPIIQALNDLQTEGKCCGIDNYTDYKNIVGEWSIPLSCCSPSSRQHVCGHPISHNSINFVKPDYDKGCIQDNYEKLKYSAPGFYRYIQFIKHLSISTPIVYCFLLSALIYYLWKYGRPKWEALFHGGSYHDSLGEFDTNSKNEIIDDGDNNSRQSDSSDSLVITQSRTLITQSVYPSGVEVADGTETDGSSENVTPKKSKDKLVRFSETLIVYPYNAVDRFTEIPVDDDGNPIPVDSSCPIRPGYRYSLARLKVSDGGTKPVPHRLSSEDLNDYDSDEDDFGTNDQ